MKDIKLAVIGSRHYQDKNRVYFEINELKKQYNIILIVSGGAQGADSFGKDYANEFKIPKLIYEADWSDMSEPCLCKINKFNKPYNALAGFKRNTKIINNCDFILAFWDEKSPGTKDSLDKAKELNKQIKIVKI